MTEVDTKKIFRDMVECTHPNDLICFYLKQDTNIEFTSIESIIEFVLDNKSGRDRVTDKLNELHAMCKDNLIEMIGHGIKHGEKGLATKIGDLSSTLLLIIDKINPKEQIHENNAPEVPENVRIKANEIQESGNVMEYLISTFNTYVIGNADICEVVELCACSQRDLTSSGLDPHVDGPSGWGKSHAVKGALNLQPKDRIHETTVSGKALYFMKALHEGDIIYSDDTEMSPEFRPTYKRLHTNFQEKTTHSVTERINGEYVANDHDIPERVIVVLTSVEIDDDEQILNRQLFAHVTADEGQADKIWDLKRRMKKFGKRKIPDTFEVQVCREINNRIWQRLFKPIDHDGILDRVSWKDKKNIRNQDKFLDLCGAFAILNYAKRDTIKIETNEDGKEIRTIKITEEDIKNARRVYILRAEVQAKNQTDEDIKYIRHLVSLGGQKISRDELAKHFKVSVPAITKRFHGKDGKGGLMAREPALRCDDPTEMTAEKEFDDNGHTSIMGRESRKKYYYYMDMEKYDQLSSYDSIIEINDKPPENLLKPETLQKIRGVLGEI